MDLAHVRTDSSAIAVVTGANRGIGLAVAEELLRAGMRVVLVARDHGRGREAQRQLARLGDVTLVTGDLGTVGGARATADAIATALPTIDVFIHNAALWPTVLEHNADGHERSFAVNHLAPFVLNRVLEPVFRASRTRVVQVSAGIYVKGKADPDRTPTGADFSKLRTYATTKLCNLLLVPLFAKRWAGQGPTINAVHPGVIRTGLGDTTGPLGVALRLVKRLWKSPAEGARPIVKLALDPALAAETGRYFHELEAQELAPVARDEALAARLFHQAEALTEAVL